MFDYELFLHVGGDGMIYLKTVRSSQYIDIDQSSGVLKPSLTKTN